MIFTIIQVVLLLLILGTVVPNVIRTFRAGKLKLGFGLLFPLLAILSVILSISLHVTRDQKPMSPRVYDQIQQLDAANTAAYLQSFRQQHPEIKNGFQPEGLTEDGIAREFDRAMMSADVPALSKLCKQISEGPFSGVTIKIITDNPRICGISRVDRPSVRKDITGNGTPRQISVYQYEMTDSKQKPFSGTCYLAVSWSKKSGSWALESAIATGSFFSIEKK
jgi:hypothetical protein